MRVALGRKGDSDHKILTGLDRFLMGELKPGCPITNGIADRWFKSMEHLSTGTRVNRMSMLRLFCMYLSQFDPRTCFIHKSFLPHRNRPAPYIYSEEEVSLILDAARKMGPDGSLRPFVVSTVRANLQPASRDTARVHCIPVELSRTDDNSYRFLLAKLTTKYPVSCFLCLGGGHDNHPFIFAQH